MLETEICYCIVGRNKENEPWAQQAIEVVKDKEEETQQAMRCVSKQNGVTVKKEAPLSLFHVEDLEQHHQQTVLFLIIFVPVSIPSFEVMWTILYSLDSL